MFNLWQTSKRILGPISFNLAQHMYSIDTIPTNGALCFFDHLFEKCSRGHNRGSPGLKSTITVFQIHVNNSMHTDHWFPAPLIYLFSCTLKPRPDKLIQMRTQTLPKILSPTICYGSRERLVYSTFSFVKQTKQKWKTKQKPNETAKQNPNFFSLFICKMKNVLDRALSASVKWSGTSKKAIYGMKWVHDQKYKEKFIIGNENATFESIMSNNYIVWAVSGHHGQ